MVKAGVFRTLEAMMALFLTFTLLLVFIPRETIEVQSVPSGVLDSVIEDTQYRNCIVLENATCVSQKIDANLADNYDYSYNITDNPELVISGLPNKRILAESIYVAGNTSNGSSRILRVFYWSKDS